MKSLWMSWGVHGPEIFGPRGLVPLSDVSYWLWLEFRYEARWLPTRLSSCQWRMHIQGRKLVYPFKFLWFRIMHANGRSLWSPAFVSPMPLRGVSSTVEKLKMRRSQPSLYRRLSVVTPDLLGCNLNSIQRIWFALKGAIALILDV